MEKNGWRLTAALLTACLIATGYYAWDLRANLTKYPESGLVARQQLNDSPECQAWGQRNAMIATRIKELSDQGFACVHGQLFKRDAGNKWERAGSCPKFTYE